MVVWQLPAIGIGLRGINHKCKEKLKVPIFPHIPPTSSFQSQRHDGTANWTCSCPLFDRVCRLILFSGGYRHRFAILQLLRLGSHCRPHSWQSVSWTINFNATYFLIFFRQELCGPGDFSKSQSHICFGQHIHSTRRLQNSFGPLRTRKKFCQDKVLQDVYPTCRCVCAYASILRCVW